MTNQQKAELMFEVTVKVHLGYSDADIIKTLTKRGWCGGTVRKYCKIARSK